MPETRFDARANFSDLIAQAVAARQALAGVNDEMDKMGRKSTEPKVKADTKEWDTKQKVVLSQLDQLDKKTATMALKANDADARAKFDRIQVQLHALTDRAKNIDVNANTAEASLQLRLISLEADRVARDRDLNINVDKSGNAVKQLGLLSKGVDLLKNKADIFSGGFIADILAVVALLSGPLAAAVAVALVGIAGLVSVVGALGLGFGALAIVIGPSLSGIGKNISNVTKAQTLLNNAVTNKDKLDALQKLHDAYDKIPAAQRPVVDLVLQLQNALAKISAFVLPVVISAMEHFLNGAKAILPFVGELAMATARGLEELGKRFEAAANAAAHNPNWQVIIHIIADLIPIYIVKLGTIFGNLFAGLVKLVAGFAPAGQSLLDWLISLTARFNEWATSRGPDELRKLMEWLRDNGPKLGDTLHNLAKALGDLIVALAKLPLTGAELDVLKSLAQVLDTIVKNPIGAWAVGILFLAGGLSKLALVVGSAAGGMIQFTRALVGLEATGIGGALGSAIVAIVRTLWSLIPAAIGAASALFGVDIAIAPIIGVAAAVVLPLIAVGAALFFLATKWKETTDFFKSGLGTLTLAFIPIIGWILLLITHWHGLWDLMKEIAAWIVSAFLDAWHFLENILGHVHDVVIAAANVFTEMGRVIRSAWDAIVSAVSAAVRFVVGLVVGAFEGMRDAVVAIWRVIADNWDQIWRIIVLVVGGAIGFIVDFVVTHFDEIKNVILTVMNFIWHNVIEPIWNGIQLTIQIVMGIILSVISAIWNAIQATINFVVNTIWHGIIEPIFNGILNTISTVLNFILNVVTTIFNTIRDIINTVVNFIWHQIIEPVFNGIRSTIETVLNFIWNNVVKPIWDGISNTISDVIHTIERVINEVLGAISDVWGRIWGGMLTTVSQIWDLIKGVINGGYHVVASVINGLLGVVDTILQVVGITVLKDRRLPADLGLASGGTIGADGIRRMESGGCTDCAVGAALAGAATPVGAGMVGHKPVAIVSEGGPHDEYVIPTDPKYRGNALALTGSLLGDLGLLAQGGTLSDSQVQAGRRAGIPAHGRGFLGLGIGPDFGPDVVSGLGDLARAGINIAGDVIEKAKSIAAGIVGEGLKLVWRKLPVPNNVIGIPPGAINTGRDEAIKFLQGQQDEQRKQSGAGIGGVGPGVTGQCVDWVRAGLAWPGHGPMGFDCMMARTLNESNCNPNAINRTDINAQLGHPSVGLEQFVPQTFASVSCPGCTDLMNPICQVCASSKCSVGNCGHGGYGCAQGGLLALASGGKIPNPAAAMDEQHQGPAAVQALFRLQKNPRTTGELMLAKQLGMAMGGVVRSPSLDFAAGMSSAPIKMPKLAGGGKTNNVTNNIYNPVGETSSESLDRTTYKLSFRGLL